MRKRSLAVLISLALAWVAWPLPVSAQISIIPGSAADGAQLFEEKGCVQCHISGTPKAATPMMLATALWNHSPKMWRAQRDHNIRPMLDSMETADLFAYFFSLAYINAPGNPNRGASLFEEKSCGRCHAVDVDLRITTSHRATPQTAPPISTWSEVSDPMNWAERMWNHSGAVNAELASHGLPWPKFSTADMVDLLTYLRAVAPSPAPFAHFQPGDPELGRVVFDQSCETCHSFGGRTAEEKIDLAKRSAPDLLTGYTTAMWNHAPFMRQKAGDKFPILQPGDMANLVAYLFAQRYFDEEGDAERGARVYESKNCVLCHDVNRRQTHAPDLAMVTERFSPITVSAAVWRHGPAMIEAMDHQELAWPHFKGSEMADLITYLNKRLVMRVGSR
jgi:cytochrome c2